jgi:hypothetical protein
MKRSSELDAFDEAMSAILRADPKAVKEAMAREKKINAERRRVKKSPSASDLSSSAKS